MDLLGQLQQNQSVPPELMQAMEALEGMDSEFRELSVPLQRLQYHCGFKQCFKGGSSSVLGRFGMGGGSEAQKTLMCLERCEAPMQEFEEVCERRMEGLMGELEQCMKDSTDERTGSACVSRVLQQSRMQQLVQKLSSDVKQLQQKYSDLE
mmetsp:Transcript_36604/g.66365  ORF Transcript_36604/g.66365 Transcript_36604/m.66365 type:complete len:151 (-) Transcript_36604:56-508(-)